MSEADPAPGGGDSTRERLRASLALLGWQAWEALLYFVGAAITIALHLGLMMLLSVTGVVTQRLAIEALVEEGLQLRAVTETVTSVFVLGTAVAVAAFGSLKVVKRVWRDFRSED